MSGIVGIYNLDGSPVERQNLGRMVDILAHRGPDGADVWQEGNIGLGHRMLWTTPESLLEKLPLVNQTGNLVLTADARIDNRDELISLLGLNDRPAEKITDSELILKAYEQWGRQCPEKLIGDFAFAIWDKQEQKLFCARDHMGVKPFYYYYQQGKFFAFASEIKGLLCLAEVPNGVNEAKVGIYLCQLSGFSAPNGDTFYQDICRLLPGHWLELSDNGFNLTSYWDLDAEAKKIQQQLKSDTEYVEEFRKRFTEAVACRLRSAYPVASTLSGGLDSSSVSCVARNLLSQYTNQTELLTVYADCGVPSTDEKAYVNTVLAQGGFKHHIAPVGGPISSALTVTPWLDQPVQMPTPAMLLAIVESVQQMGARVLLTGHDGDTIVSHGQDYPTELIEAGEWDYLKKLVTELNKGKNVSDSDLKKRVESRLYDSASDYLKELTKKFNVKNYVKALKVLFKVSNRWKFIGKKFLYLLARSPYHQLQYWRNTRWKNFNTFINYKFADKIKLSQLLKKEYDYQFAYLPTEYLNHYRGITSGNLQDGSDQIDAISSGLAIEPRHPFLDKRLVELCLAAPARLKFCNGFGRGNMRRAMKDILPEEVRHRGSKVDFYGFIVSKMETEEIDLIEKFLLTKNSALYYYLGAEVLPKEYRKILNNKNFQGLKTRKARRMACAMFLTIWLSQSRN